MKLLACAAACVMTAPLHAAPPADPFAGTVASDGLLPVHIDRTEGKILLTLPAPGADNVAGRFLYATTLRTGIGSAELGLDKAQNGDTRLLAFRRIGNKIAIQYENPRFRATGATAPEQAAARDSFIVTTAWMGPIASTLADGRIVIDIAPFLAGDTMGIAPALAQGGARGYKLVGAMSTADPGATKIFPDNIELEALQTYASDTPGQDMENVAPDARQISFTVHHSLVRLPDAGYKPRAFDQRAGGFASQAVDFAVPLGGALVYDLADRFRLEKTDPKAARSTVKKPIIFYIDTAAPEPIRQALFEGVSWWKDAFEAAGLIDAFQVKMLPPGADPMDVRYNVVNWVDRATRGWSFGQVIADPRTGEIIKGSVLLGALRVRQDIIIYEGLVGTSQLNSGGPNDPVRVALARIRQLGAHEVGHALGFVHNFAGSTQGRNTVMDYPPPRIGLKNGAPDLSDAYAVGGGAWDRFVVDWLYGSDSDAVSKAKADAAVKAGLHFVSDEDSRGLDVGQPWGSLWDDGADPVAELNRLMTVRTAALARFGTASLTTGEPIANLRRKLVPVWLMQRYQIEAAAKLVGGIDYHYSVLGDGNEASPPVPAAAQNAALDALLTTLAPQTLTIPAPLLPLLSAGQQGNNDRQYTTEIFSTAGGPVFDPLVAADVAASITLDALLAPARLSRLAQQQGAGALSLDDMLQRLERATIDNAQGPVAERIAWRTVLTMARARRDAAGMPAVATALDERLKAIEASLARGKASWSLSLAATLKDRGALNGLLDAPKTKLKVPPGMPIGDVAEYMDLP
jgi:hypothetical protein